MHYRLDRLYKIVQRAVIAQLVERPTEKPGAILIRVRIPDAAFVLFFLFLFFFLFLLLFFSFYPSQLPVQTLTESVQPLSEVLCINICAPVKIPKHGQLSHTIVWTHENTAHTARTRCSCGFYVLPRQADLNFQQGAKKNIYLKKSCLPTGLLRCVSQV